MIGTVKNKILRSALPAGTLFMLMSSCTIFEPAIPAQSYIHIDSISVVTDYTTQGSRSNKIYDAWVIYDNQYLGTFPLPADIPIMGDGSHSLIIKGGIMENGIAASRAAYPKYVSFDTTINIKALDKITIKPVVTYLSVDQFAQIEDFDDASLSLVSTSSGTAPLWITQQNDTNAFEGNSGLVVLDANHSVFEVASSVPFGLPVTVPVYIELNYKGDNDFTIGAFMTTTNGVVKSELITVRASPVWKKIYITYSELGGVDISGFDYKVYIHADKNTSLTTANLYFDNLKVVY